MIDNLSLDLLDKGLYTSQLVLTVGYDIENLARDTGYKGEIKTDLYNSDNWYLRWNGEIGLEPAGNK